MIGNETSHRSDSLEYYRLCKIERNQNMDMRIELSKPIFTFIKTTTMNHIISDLYNIILSGSVNVSILEMSVCSSSVGILSRNLPS